MPSIFSLAKFSGVGAVLGGIVGGIADDSQTLTGKIGGMAQGAAIGALGGAAISKVGRAAAWAGTKKLPGVGWKATKGLGRAAMGAGGFVMRHPSLSLYGTIGLAGMYGLSNTGPGNPSRSAKQMAQMAAIEGTSTGFELGEGGSARQMDRVAFEDSAAGLSLALHNGRHR